jgi:hypothetical protein
MQYREVRVPATRQDEPPHRISLCRIEIIDSPSGKAAISCDAGIVRGEGPAPPDRPAEIDVTY